MESKIYQYSVNFVKDEGIIVATVPSFPGCHSYGHSLEEAEKNIQEAIKCYIKGLQEIGEDIPVENNF